MTKAEIDVLDKLLREIESAKRDLENTDNTVLAAFDLSKEVVRGVRDAGYWLQDVV